MSANYGGKIDFYQQAKLKKGSAIVNKDEEYVHSVWALVHRCDGSYREYPRGTVLVRDKIRHWLDFPSWSAAAEFTRDWQEQVRQLREEISVQQSIFEHAECFAKLSGQRDSHGLIATAEKRVAPVKRTLARLEVELARLTAAMKPEAL